VSSRACLAGLSAALHKEKCICFTIVLCVLCELCVGVGSRVLYGLERGGGEGHVSILMTSDVGNGASSLAIARFFFKKNSFFRFVSSRISYHFAVIFEFLRNKNLRL